MKFQYKDIEMDYLIEGEGKALLFIHGYGIDKSVMINSFEPFIDKKFKRIYVDLPHMGHSNWPESINSSDDYLNVIDQFIKKVVPELFGVIGFSYGGYLAIGLQQRYPELPSCLICPVIKPKRENRNLPKHKVVYKDNFIKEFKGDLGAFNGNVIQTEELYYRFVKDYSEGFTLANNQKLSDIFHNSYEFSFAIDKKVKGLTLGLFGRLDSVVGYKDIREIDTIYNHFDEVVLDHAGHGLMMEQKELFEGNFSMWLRRL